MRQSIPWLVVAATLCGLISPGVSDDRVPVPPDRAALSTFAAVDPAAGVPDFLREPLPAEIPPSTWLKAFEEIRRVSGRPLQIDRAGLTASGFHIEMSSPLTPAIPKGTPLFQALDLLCRESETKPRIAWSSTEDSIRVIDPDAANALSMKLTRIGDLLKGGCRPADLIDVIHEATNGSWNHEEPGTGRVELQGEVLLVRQNAAAHREIAVLLAGLRSPADIVWCGRSEKDREIADALARRVVRVPAGDYTAKSLAAEMERLTGTPMEYAAGFLQSPSDQASWKLPETEGIWRNVLDAILPGSFGLDVRDGRVRVVHEPMSPEVRFPAIYNLRSRIFSWHTPTKVHDVILGMTQGPWEWEEPETGTISILWDRGQVVVWSDLWNHREIERLLKETADAEPPVDLNAIETRRYEFRNETAEDLAAAIPQVVAPESWRTPGHPERVGVTFRVRRPEPSTKAQSGGPGYEILVVRNSVRVLQEVEQFLVELGWDADPDRVRVTRYRFEVPPVQDDDAWPIPLQQKPFGAR